MAKMRDLALLLSRFGVVGLLNTALSLSVIMGLEWGLGTAPALANAAGYGVGITSGFVLSRRFVFRSATAARSTAPRYLMAVVGGFCVNQAVLAEMHALLGAGALNHLAAQVCAMGSYTLTVFPVCRYWVFRAPIDPVIATA